MNARKNEVRIILLIRKELGLTQQEFATKLGVALPTISRWENRVNNPSPLALDKVESFLRTLGHDGRMLINRYLNETVRS